jgi:putative peptide zinc metalloprotease protein
LRSAGVRLRGSADEVIRVVRMTIIPAQQSVLPSAVLGWMGGGDIATRQDDRSGTRSAESFFELRASLDESAGARLWHGRSGKLRCALPRKPLLAQWWRDLRQLIQRRLQV